MINCISIHLRLSAGFYFFQDDTVYRNVGEGDNYPEPMFAILNYAKITDSSLEGEWVMEVDRVKHEIRNLN